MRAPPRPWWLDQWGAQYRIFDADGNRVLVLGEEGTAADILAAVNACHSLGIVPAALEAKVRALVVAATKLRDAIDGERTAKHGLEYYRHQSIQDQHELRIIQALNGVTAALAPFVVQEAHDGIENDG
jgi:hypothetical protein